MFSEKAMASLKKMKVDPDALGQDLKSKFGDKATVFNDLLERFPLDSTLNGCHPYTNEDFTCFWDKLPDSFKAEENSELCDVVYELFNNLRRYLSGGVWKVYKKRQSEWLPLPIKVDPEDVPIDKPNAVGTLGDSVQIYRGLSLKEHRSGYYGQSWTICLEVARRFADNTYEHIKDGAVVTTMIKKSDILHYDNSCEFEVVVRDDAIKKATIVKNEEIL